jgi:hypothetical protein
VTRWAEALDAESGSVAAAQVLVQLGADLDSVRRTVRSLLHRQESQRGGGSLEMAARLRFGPGAEIADALAEISDRLTAIEERLGISRPAEATEGAAQEAGSGGEGQSEGKAELGEGTGPEGELGQG